MSLPEVTQTYRDPHHYPKGIAFLDDQYVPMNQAKVSVLDYGFLHSDATYDVVHVWKGAFFRLDLHLDRFFAGLEKLHMAIPYDRDEITEILQNCVALSGHRDAYVELICTRGNSPDFSRDPRDAINRFMAFAIPFGSVANKDQMDRGLHLAISDTVRIPPSSVDPSIKNYHWLDLVQGLYDAYEKGAETTLLVNGHGNIAEGPGFNIFCVKDGVVTTPDSGVLLGITRQTVFDLCAELGITCEATQISRDKLIAADEIFISSTAGGVMPVTRLNDYAVGGGQLGPIYTQVHRLYWDKHNDPAWSLRVRYE
ncbi:branched-chain amino acid transferase [Kiloniella spongiae]|uniref:Probable branched-chain-amino-acid aminotransferase n=1 Tax=Kiloniella spongiae TaxID=1489064 RepID=A0A0H2MY45_9PROT|nr:aminotransferase class IV [Kiloniella spongiae]KLN61635.1 branched-chain amino acid transferase [Kiloniella spongiae]